MFSADGYQALRHGAGVVARGDRGVLTVTGGDRLTWLQGLVTNDVVALPPGGICDAAYLTPQGRMISDMRVVNLADRVLLDVPGSLAEPLHARLSGLLFAEDAEIANATSTLSQIDVHGPDAPAVVRRIAPDGTAGVIVVADSPFHVPGFTLFADAAIVEAIMGRVAAAGGVVTSLETLEVLRVEAGRPAFLIDMDEHTIPLEAGIEERAISFTKGCYVGQEVIVRVMHRGQGRVAKKLVGLTLATSEVPRAGSPILAAGKEVGKVTSAAWSPALERALALGYVHRDYVEAGTVLAIKGAEASIEATVSTLPFVNS